MTKKIIKKTAVVSLKTCNNTNVVRSYLYTVVNTLLNCQGSIFYLKCYYYLHNVSGDNA